MKHSYCLVLILYYIFANILAKLIIILSNVKHLTSRNNSTISPEPKTPLHFSAQRGSEKIQLHRNQAITMTLKSDHVPFLLSSVLLIQRACT